MAARQHILSPTALQALRRLALFFAMLMSGGLMIFPRVPLMLAILALCVVIKGPTLGIKRNMGPIAVVLFAIFVIAVVGAQGFDAMSVATRFANFIVGLALVALFLGEPKETLANDLIPIFRLMCIQIIATVVVAIILPNAFVAIPVLDAVYNTVFWIFTYHVTIETSSIFVRPDGFFFEPGVLQIYINIFFFIALFIRRKAYDIPLAVISILLLQSTTGILIACVLIGASYLQRFSKATFSEKFLVAIVGPILAVPIIFVAAQNINAKVSGDYRGSSWARQYDFYTGVNVIKAHPWLGVGFDNDRYKAEASRLGYGGTELDFRSTSDRSSSNGLIALIASIGIPMSIPFLLAMFRQKFFRRPLLFGVLLTLAFFGEAVMLTPFFIMIMFSAMLSQQRRAAAPARRPQRPMAPGAPGPGAPGNAAPAPPQPAFRPVR